MRSSMANTDKIISREAAEALYGSMVKLNGSREIRVGDDIVTDFYPDGLPKRVAPVTEVQHYACSQRATHVNGRDCYSQYVPLHVIGFR